MQVYGLSENILPQNNEQNQQLILTRSEHERNQQLILTRSEHERNQQLILTRSEPNLPIPNLQNSPKLNKSASNFVPRRNLSLTKSCEMISELITEKHLLIYNNNYQKNVISDQILIENYQSEDIIIENIMLETTDLCIYENCEMINNKCNHVVLNKKSQQFILMNKNMLAQICTRAGIYIEHFF